MKPDPTDQTEVVKFLSDPETHGIGTPVEMITTHSAYVFLAGDLAFKIKRAVKYNYLDFSTLDARRKVIAHELDLNAPAAPAIYDRDYPRGVGSASPGWQGDAGGICSAHAQVSPRERADLHR